MSTRRWQGGAQGFNQITTYLFGGTWEADDVTRVVIGSKTYDFIAGSTTITTLIDSIVTAWNALSATDWPEFAEVTASRSGSSLVLTCDTVGLPFTATLTPLESDFSVAGAQTIEGGTTATTGTTSTSPKGPNDWNTAANWSGGAVPVGADDVILDDGTFPIRYGLSQSGVTLASLTVTPDFTGDGEVGLPKVNEDGSEYPEYRTDYLTISATTITIGEGSGGGSSRIKINTGSVQTTLRVYSSGGGDDVPAVLWKGTHASNALEAIGEASIGVAVYGGEAATLTTLKMGPGASVEVGSGVTLGTVTNDGGTLVNSCAVGTSLTQTAGQAMLLGSGNVAQLTLRGGTCDYRTSGTLGGNTIVSGSALLLFDNDLRTKTVSNPIDLYGRASFISDAHKVVGTLIVDGNEGADPATQVRWGTHYRLTRGTVA